MTKLSNSQQSAEIDMVSNSLPESLLVFQISYVQGGYKVLPKLGKELVSIGDYAFSGSHALEKDLVLPEKVRSIGAYAFSQCDLERIHLPNGFTTIKESTFSRSSLMSIELPNSLISIGNNAFESCSKLERIEIPDGVTSLGNQTFRDCSSLADILMPNSMTSIGHGAFEGCYSLEHITIPAGVKAMGVSVFEDCRSLKAINLLTSSDFALPSYTFPADLRELYLPFDLPADYDVEFTAQSVYVPLGCKAGYVANIQKNNPEYMGENVVELDFDAQSFAINAAEGYGTYYTDRPFVMPEGVEGGVVTPGDAEGVMRVDYRYAAGDVVPAGVGLVLKGEPGTYAYESKYFYEAPAAPAGNLLSGTVQQTVLPEDDAVAYYMLSYDREGANIGFYWGAEDGGPFINGAHRAYLALPRGEAALAKAFVLDGDHLATGIGDVTSPTADAPATVYTLRGTKVTTPVDQLPRGLYIINGKKVFVPGK